MESDNEEVQPSLLWSDDKFFLTQAQQDAEQQGNYFPNWLEPYKEGIRLFHAMKNKQFIGEHPKLRFLPSELQHQNDFTTENVDWDRVKEKFEQASTYLECPMAGIWLHRIKETIWLEQTGNDKRSNKPEIGISIIKAIQKLADAGVPDAQYALGYYYSELSLEANAETISALSYANAATARCSYPLAHAALTSFFVKEKSRNREKFHDHADYLSNLADLTDPVIFACNVESFLARQILIKHENTSKIQAALDTERDRYLKEKRWMLVGVIGGWLANPLALPLLCLVAGCLTTFLSPLSAMGAVFIGMSAILGLIVAPVGLLIYSAYLLSAAYTDYQEQNHSQSMGLLNYLFVKLPSRAWTWIKNHRLQTFVFFVGACVTGLFMMGILMFGDLMFPALEVMRQALFDALMDVASLPGLGFLAPLITTTVTSVLTLIFALLAPLFLADAIRRIINTYELYEKPSEDYKCKEEDVEKLYGTRQLARVLHDVQDTQKAGKVSFERNELVWTWSYGTKDEALVSAKSRNSTAGNGEDVTVLPKDSVSVVCRA